MSTAIGGYRNLHFLNAVCTPYPHELFFDPQFSPGLDNIPAQIALMRRLRDFVD
jgi:hypothetical protein